MNRRVKGNSIQGTVSSPGKLLSRTPPHHRRGSGSSGSGTPSLATAPHQHNSDGSEYVEDDTELNDALRELNSIKAHYDVGFSDNPSTNCAHSPSTDGTNGGNCNTSRNIQTSRISLSNNSAGNDISCPSAVMKKLVVAEEVIKKLYQRNKELSLKMVRVRAGGGDDNEGSTTIMMDDDVCAIEDEIPSDFRHCMVAAPPSTHSTNAVFSGERSSTTAEGGNHNPPPPPSIANASTIPTSPKPGNVLSSTAANTPTFIQVRQLETPLLAEIQHYQEESLKYIKAISEQRQEIEKLNQLVIDSRAQIKSLELDNDKLKSSFREAVEEGTRYKKNYGQVQTDYIRLSAVVANNVSNSCVSSSSYSNAVSHTKNLKDSVILLSERLAAMEEGWGREVVAYNKKLYSMEKELMLAYVDK